MDTETTEKRNKKVFKYLFNFIIFVFLIWLTFKILLKDQNHHELLFLLRNAKLSYVLLGLLCMILYFMFDSLNLKRTINALNEKCSFLNAIRYTLVGFFFSSITPAASGGQPMQIYVMHKEGIKVSSATLALVLNLFSFQCVTIGLELISIIFLHQYMDKRNNCIICYWYST